MTIEVVDRRSTPIGEVVLRRREDEAGFEVLLGGAHLMSSRVTQAETRLAEVTLASVRHAPSEVLVAGLGLGYTAAAALAHPQVRAVVAVEYLEAVIDWHRRDLLPLSKALLEDPRCRIVHRDFVAYLNGARAQSWDALLLDIDHSPRAHLALPHAVLYEEAGLRRIREVLSPGGAFGLWSGDAPDPGFLRVMRRVFEDVRVEEVRFRNVLAACEEINTIYLGGGD